MQWLGHEGDLPLPRLLFGRRDAAWLPAIKNARAIKNSPYNCIATGCFCMRCESKSNRDYSSISKMWDGARDRLQTEVKNWRAAAYRPEQGLRHTRLSCVLSLKAYQSLRTCSPGRMPLGNKFSGYQLQQGNGGMVPL